MPTNQQPSRARQAYKAAIDALVAETYRNACDRLVREDGIYCKAEGYAEANALVGSMSKEQRKILADILFDQRKSAISSALVLLDWQLSKKAVVVAYHGEPIPFGLAEGGPHGDYLARFNGWQWLDDDTIAGA